MESGGIWAELGHRHIMWELLRYFLSIRNTRQQASWLEQLKRDNALSTDTAQLPIPAGTVELLVDYLNARESVFSEAFDHLRTEAEANDFCSTNDIAVGVTATKSSDHHQSSKALVATVSSIAERACESRGLSIDPNPQRRCVWCNDQGLHVTARNLDGAIPSTANPRIIWEIKEYWGKTKGGSKMSDAVYECNLIGRELRDYEAESGSPVVHIVFVDGKDQWTARKSDLKRFIDLTYQGLIDHLFIGSEVETNWNTLLCNLLDIDAGEQSLYLVSND